MSEEIRKMLNEGGKLSIEIIDDEEYEETIEGSDIIKKVLLATLISDMIEKKHLSKEDVEEAVKIGIKDAEEETEQFKIIEVKGSTKEEVLKIIRDLMN